MASSQILVYLRCPKQALAFPSLIMIALTHIIINFLRGPETYVVSFPRVLTSVIFPVEGYLERENKLGRLMEHFMYRHWKQQIPIQQ